MRIAGHALISFMLVIQAGSSTISAQPVFPSDKTAESDPSALAEITAFYAASASSGWSGIAARGTVILPGVDTPCEAKLWISDTGSQRLDTVAPDGVRSIRMVKDHGVFLLDGRLDHSFDQGLAFAGLTQLPALLQANFKALNPPVKDAGTVMAGSLRLHRVILNLSPNPNEVLTQRKSRSVDLYFDATTHLLKKTVAMVHLFGPSGNLVKQVTEYEDYRPAGSSLIPYQITQTVDGQPFWTIYLETASALEKQNRDLFTYSSK